MWAGLCLASLMQGSAQSRAGLSSCWGQLLQRRVVVLLLPQVLVGGRQLLWVLKFSFPALPSHSVASSVPCFFQAMFEIITSEFSYMHSLGILVYHFMRSEELKETMTQTEHHHLFSNISDILTVSTRQVGAAGVELEPDQALELCSPCGNNHPLDC